MPSPDIRIGARGSPLALAQAEQARQRLGAVPGEPTPVALVPIRTTGDRIGDRSLAEAGGKGLFTKEIDEALIAGEIDAAVHSAKDMPTDLPEGIVIAACLKRADVRDAFVSPVAAQLADLPKGATVGTSSPRRRALTLRARPDLVIVNLRGNVGTRLDKLADGQVQAAILAYAGLIRLGLADRATSLMEPDQWPPAAGQGAIAIAARADDRRTIERLMAIDDRDTSIGLATERAFLAALGGSCRTPIGGLATVVGSRIAFHGIIVTPDGRSSHEVRRAGAVEDAEAIGTEAGAELRRRGGPDFFAAA
ncbi:MAG: hydroxymethylbilane synthase [Bauldia sp.]